MKYLYSFTLGIPFAVLFFLVITFLSDGEKFEPALSILFLLGLTGPLFVGLLLV